MVALLAPSSTPPAARMELKKLLQTRNVRKGIAEGILARVFATDPAPESTLENESARPTSVSTEEIDVVHVCLAVGRY